MFYYFYELSSKRLLIISPQKYAIPSQCQQPVGIQTPYGHLFWKCNKFTVFKNEASTYNIVKKYRNRTNLSFKKIRFKLWIHYLKKIYIYILFYSQKKEKKIFRIEEPLERKFRRSSICQQNALFLTDSFVYLCRQIYSQVFV